MKKLLAIVAIVADVAAYSDDFAAKPDVARAKDAIAPVALRTPAKKSYTAPDGVNIITETTDSFGLKTYSQTLAHVCDCGSPNCGMMTNDPSRAKGQNVIEKKVRSPLGKEIDQLKRKCGIFTQVVGQNLFAFESMLTNLIERVETLEKAEAKRMKRVEEMKARREERKQKRETKKDTHQTLQEAIRRGKRVEKKEAK